MNPLRNKMHRFRLLLSHAVFSGQSMTCPSKPSPSDGVLHKVITQAVQANRFLAGEAQAESWTDILNDAVCVWFIESDRWVVISNTDYVCAENNYNKLSHEGFRDWFSTTFSRTIFLEEVTKTGYACNAHKGISNNFGRKPMCIWRNLILRVALLSLS